jgi:hypothetical protein
MHSDRSGDTEAATCGALILVIVAESWQNLGRGTALMRTQFWARNMLFHRGFPFEPRGVS